MNNQQNDSSALDLFRERLASPFLFTFFWVSCTWNWKLIFWFLYEPLKPSIKFVRIPFEWEVLFPVLITVVVICVVPWLNNVVEVIKQFAEHQLNLWLHRLNWKKMVTESQYQKLEDEVVQLKEKQHQLINDNVTAQENENQAKEELLSSKAEISSKLEKLSELEDERKTLLFRVEGSETVRTVLEKKLGYVNEKLEKIKDKSNIQLKILEDARPGLDGNTFELANHIHHECSEILRLIEYDNSQTVMPQFINTVKGK
ncbi:hypothetical protein I6F43_07935 [Pseudoalteromonas sp. NZS71_1]|uniref:hypothetical protein n=1 Tax=Pseudoalteromonas sp. NZS71_1 TaxID=2792072 RepID=UPI0018CD9D8B|nr:hypothetical protein [Pseudoalteromonas sp. NZS71_1]MBH0034610.1 hypothetical protein [Pseudoalteromonas sp. NZS71_1]